MERKEMLIRPQYLNVPTPELVFVQNATTGVNTVLRSLIFAPDEYILYAAPIYGACEKTVAYITETTPAQAAKIEFTFPVEDDWLVSAFAARIADIERAGGKVKVALFDTVVSMPGVRLPFERITEVCRAKGVLSLIDGAHGIGHVALDLKALDADFFVTNCHKYVSPSSPPFSASASTSASTSPPLSLSEPRKRGP
jgi:selenocysteine lyase/cysteine desulfurase